MKKTKHILKSVRGISLVETTIVLGLSAGLFLMMGSLLKSFKGAANSAEEDLIASAGESVGARRIWQDIRKGGVSFNTVAQPDGVIVPPTEGRQPLFYDYLLDATCETNCTRRIALTPENGALVLLTEDPVRRGAHALNPNSFYDLDGPVPDPSDLNSSGTLVFNEEKLLAELEELNPQYLQESAILQFYSLISERPASSGRVDLQVPPLTASFLTSRSDVPGDADESLLRLDDTLGLIRQAHPKYDYPYRSVDDFFRAVPAVGARSAYAMVRAVQIVKYYVREVEFDGSTTGALMRSVYDPAANTFGEPKKIAQPICGVEFVRTNISIPSIRATVVEDKGALSRGRQVASSSGCRRDGGGRILLENSLIRP